MFWRRQSLIGITSILYKNSIQKTIDFSQNKRNLYKIGLSLPFMTYFSNRSNALCSQVLFSIEDGQKNAGFKYFLSHSVWPILKNFKRFLHLMYIFIPSFVTLPLAIFPPFRIIWIKIFVFCVERAGVVWIKLFQYLSHRRDVIGEQLAQNFVHLREFSPQHSLKETQEMFRRLYDKNIQDFFQEFNPVPVASGSVSQVYAGKLHGQKVAIKVKHPNIEQNIERDISIVFGISRFLSYFSKIFEVPVTESSLKKMLTEQIYFKKEKQNLTKYRQIFTHPHISFPKPFDETTDQILIMSYIEGKPITYYEKNHHVQNKIIARVGASAFFEMLMVHNFIHADCHGGNIYVTLKKREHTFYKYIKFQWDWFKTYLWSKIIRSMLDTKILQKLADDHLEEEKILKKQQLEFDHEVQVTLLDVGMVITLEQNKRKYFINFLSEVIQGNPKQCARMIHKISKYGGTLLLQTQHPQYLNDLQQMFTLIRKCSLENLQGIQVLSGMLRVIRKHRMKLDGQFATLLTDMLILQGIAKDLDPKINILRCAVPYLPYK